MTAESKSPSVTKVAAVFVVVAVMAATLVLFLLFMPKEPGEVFWMAFADVLGMVLVFGAFEILALYASIGVSPSRVTAATRIAITTILAIFFIVGTFLSVIFAVAGNGTNDLNRSFCTVLTIKWLLMLVIITTIWIAGQEGAPVRAAREESRGRRLALLERLQAAAAKARDARLSEGVVDDLRLAADELEGLCNRVRPWSSARPSGDADSRVEKLASDLVEAVNALPAAPESGQREAVAKVRRISADIAQTVRSSSSTPSSGVS